MKDNKEPQYVRITLSTENYAQDILMSKEMIFQAKYPTHFLERYLKELWYKEYGNK